MLFVLFTQAQQKGSYKICKDVVIYNITFSKSLGNYYKKSIEKELVELKFSVERLSHGKLKCYLVKNYAVYNGEIANENKQEVDISYFNEIIENLNKIESENIKEDRNVADGITCSIEIYGENFKIRLADNWKDEKKTEFYNLFESVWNKYKQ